MPPEPSERIVLRPCSVQWQKSLEELVVKRQIEIGALEVFLRYYEDISILLKTKRIAITGAPATGKTTLSAALESLGYPVFHEQAREIIQQWWRKDASKEGCVLSPACPGGIGGRAGHG